ncbi:hypothetical protein FM037_08270 [Shewanella psychropiezotolerans]|uniref:Uncharacterized protein n=2 Tax=Shewanella TaxID=22 RepID=A0ABX5WW14_9GAMM|nr:hypothetical protein [Shewanella psychropiezotolerans]QDO83224.1 hypothetical protein FM037_08270 [Shewanella psychropiezotolerans]
MSFTNDLSSLPGFYVKAEVNTQYKMSCKEEKCFYSKTSVTSNIKEVYKSTLLSSGDKVIFTMKWGGKDGVIIDTREVTVSDYNFDSDYDGVIDSMDTEPELNSSIETFEQIGAQAWLDSLDKEDLLKTKGNFAKTTDYNSFIIYDIDNSGNLIFNTVYPCPPNFAFFGDIKACLPLDKVLPNNDIFHGEVLKKEDAQKNYIESLTPESIALISSVSGIDYDYDHDGVIDNIDSEPQLHSSIETMEAIGGQAWLDSLDKEDLLNSSFARTTDYNSYIIYDIDNSGNLIFNQVNQCPPNFAFFGDIKACLPLKAIADYEFYQKEDALRDYVDSLTPESIALINSVTH